MKVRDLIKELLDAPMDSEVSVRPKELTDEDDSYTPIGVDYEFPESGKDTVIRYD